MLGIWAANRRAKAMEEQAAAANEQAAAANRQARIANEGSRENRFRDMVTHLGNDKSSVRLGGIYGLYQLAEDYWEIEDQQRSANIIGILHAHIRQTTSSEEYQKAHRDRPSEEIQSMLDLLLKQTEKKILLRGVDNQIDLSRCWLAGADLSSAQLQQVNLNKAQLQGANLRNAQLQGANLMDAHLQRVDLKKAQLQRTQLMFARFQRADLRNAQLQGADLDLTQLQGANLHDAQLQGADLRNARLQGANLHDAQLQGANLHEAQLQGANLDKAQLQGADLNEAQLQGVSAQLSWYDMYPFDDYIQSRIGCQSDCENTIFLGGIESTQIEEVTGVLNNQIKAMEQSHLPKHLWETKLVLLRHSLAGITKSMKQHLGKPASNKPPEKAITGSYSQEDADRWIKEYKEATKPKKIGQ